jgi:hypothetical protein
MPTPESGSTSGTTVDPAKVDLAIVNVTGRTGVATAAMGELNGLGFDVTDDDLLAPEGSTQDAVTVEYDPANLAQALTVMAAVPGATLAPTEGLGSQVRLMLGKSFDGTVTAVRSGVSVTGTLAESTATASTGGESTVTSLSSGDLAAVNAGEALCA